MKSFKLWISLSIFSILILSYSPGAWAGPPVDFTVTLGEDSFDFLGFETKGDGRVQIIDLQVGGPLEDTTGRLDGNYVYTFTLSIIDSDNNPATGVTRGTQNGTMILNTENGEMEFNLNGIQEFFPNGDEFFSGNITSVSSSGDLEGVHIQGTFSQECLSSGCTPVVIEGKRIE